MNLSQFLWNAHGAERNFYFRSDSVVDRGVIDQIFRNEDYRVSHPPQGRALLAQYQSAPADTFLIRGENLFCFNRHLASVQAPVAVPAVGAAEAAPLALAA